MSRKHGLPRGTSAPATACIRTCWWSTGTDGRRAPDHLGDLGRPHPGRIHDMVGLDPAARREDRLHVVRTAQFNSGHAGAEPELGAEGARGIGDGVGRDMGVDVPVLGDPDASV